MDRDPPRYRFSAEGGLDLNGVLRAGEGPRFGPVKIDLEAKGKGPELAAMTGQGTLRLDAGSLPGFSSMVQIEELLGVSRDEKTAFIKANMEDHRQRHLYRVDIANGRTTLLGKDAFQEADVTGLTYGVVKHSYLLKDATDIPRATREAFHIATTGRPEILLRTLAQLAALDAKIGSSRWRQHAPSDVFL